MIFIGKMSDFKDLGLKIMDKTAEAAGYKAGQLLNFGITCYILASDVAEASTKSYRAFRTTFDDCRELGLTVKEAAEIANERFSLVFNSTLATKTIEYNLHNRNR